ncbi:MAG TPA: FKBP-type peptidyl-prolyl cis-trans isomerase [Lacunisphaera sp.]
MSQVSAALVTLGLLTAASAQEPVKFTIPGASAPAAQPAAPVKTPAAPAAPAAAPAAPAVKFTEAQLMEAVGDIFVLQSRLAIQVQALEFTPAQKDALLRGITLAVGGKELPYDAQQIQAQLQEFMGKKQEAFMTKLRMQNLAEGTAFFTKLKENKNVVELPSGLRYEILKPATGAPGKPGQVATIHYTGALLSGQVFDSSVERKEPLELLLQAANGTNPNGAMPGMVEGLLKVGVGGKARLYIPPSLAYGDDGFQGIPPGATLIFDVEVLGVKDAPKEAPAAK